MINGLVEMIQLVSLDDVRSSSGQNLSNVSNIPASQNLPDNDPLTNGPKILGEKIPDSDVAGVVVQAEINNLNVSDSISGNTCKEKPLGFEQNEIKDFNVLDFNGEVHEAKRKSSRLKGTTIRRRLEEGNEELEKSPKVNSEVYDSRKSSDK
ncbi:hypothetical protein IEQ34_016647 [Dendrobium chrysotoxum]|uniref:Uncharacterized protein n=1 Tax=Dendrobium chrysotoxum TaxID=161865 RepID=A0AAV7GG75_DENCH|nr:hypothetical protein IEQ34_016647 [Dendrobium chrysotoxum]